MRRRTLGLALAPLAGSLPGVLTVAVTESEPLGFNGLVHATVLFAVFSYAGAAIFGVPIVAAFAGLRIQALGAYILAGAVAGLACAAAIDHFLYFGMADPPVYPLVIVSAVVVSSVYWMLAERLLKGAPCKDAGKPSV